jgi:hypothetical protein
MRNLMTVDREGWMIPDSGRAAAGKKKAPPE